jgi:hypothetical protein
LTVNICDSNVISGTKAVKSLDRYIRKLEKRNVKGLTEKQVRSLIKTAKVLRNVLSQKQKVVSPGRLT